MSALTETEIRNAEMACHALCVEYAEIVDTQDYTRLPEIFADDAAIGTIDPPKPHRPAAVDRP